MCERACLQSYEFGGNNKHLHPQYNNQHYGDYGYRHTLQTAIYEGVDLEPPEKIHQPCRLLEKFRLIHL